MKNNKLNLDYITILGTNFLQIEELDDDDQLELYQAIFRYSFYSVEPEFSKKYLKGIWIPIKFNLDNSIDNHNKKVENGKKGGAPKGNNNARKKELPTPIEDKPSELNSSDINEDNLKMDTLPIQQENVQPEPCIEATENNNTHGHQITLDEMIEDVSEEAKMEKLSIDCGNIIDDYIAENYTSLIDAEKLLVELLRRIQTKELTTTSQLTEPYLIQFINGYKINKTVSVKKKDDGDMTQEDVEKLARLFNE